MYKNTIRLRFNKGIPLFSNINIFSIGNSSQWLKRHLNDDYVKKSKILQYRSRAAFKILEIQTKFNIFKPGQLVLDFGAAPGGWSQVIAPLIKSNTKKPTVVAIDLLPIENIEGVSILKGDLTSKKMQDEIFRLSDLSKFDVICSDACPEFIGIKGTDISRSLELNKTILKYSLKYLKNDGHLIMKAFEGSNFTELTDNIKTQFKKINRFKPTSSRSESGEHYLICLYYTPNKEALKRDILASKKDESKQDENSDRMLQLNKSFSKLIGNEMDTNSKDITELKENINHKNDIIKSKIEDAEFNLIQMDEITNAMQSENKLAMLRVDDMEENKTLKSYVARKETNLKNNNDYIKNLGSSITDIHNDDYEKNLENQHESSLRRKQKAYYNRISKKQSN